MGPGKTKWKTIATNKSLVGLLLQGRLLAHEQTYVQVVRASWKPNTSIQDQIRMHADEAVKLVSDGTGKPVNQCDEESSQAPEVKIRGVCWRYAQRGHHGNVNSQRIYEEFYPSVAIWEP